MAATMLLEIITPDREAFKKEVRALSVPTRDGIVGILPHHTSLFTTLVEGEIKITLDGKEWFLSIGGGFMEVIDNHVSILVSRAVHADELNEAEIKKAHVKAKEVLANKVKGQERIDAQSLLRRSILDLKVIRHKTRFHQPLQGLS